MSVVRIMRIHVTTNLYRRKEDNMDDSRNVLFSFFIEQSNDTVVFVFMRIYYRPSKSYTSESSRHICKTGEIPHLTGVADVNRRPWYDSYLVDGV